MQLTFEFLKETVLRWDDLNKAARDEFVEKLARVIARATFPDQEKDEERDDD